MRAWYLMILALVAICVAACGGNDTTNGGSTTSMVPEETLASLKAAVLTKDRDTISNRIDLDYLDDCESHDDLLNSIMAVIAVGGTLTVDILPITGKNVDDTKGTGRFNGGFRIKSVNGGTTSELLRSGTIHLRARVGIWRIEGDQTCTH